MWGVGNGVYVAILTIYDPCSNADKFTLWIKIEKINRTIIVQFGVC